MLKLTSIAFILDHPVPKTVGVHPSLRTFEVKYRWVSVQEEDFAFGVQIMFVGAVIGFLILFCVVIYNSEFGSGGHTLKSSGKKVTSSKVK